MTTTFYDFIVKNKEQFNEINNDRLKNFCEINKLSPIIIPKTYTINNKEYYNPKFYSYLIKYKPDNINYLFYLITFNENEDDSGLNHGLIYLQNIKFPEHEQKDIDILCMFSDKKSENECELNDESYLNIKKDSIKDYYNTNQTYLKEIFNKLKEDQDLIETDINKILCLDILCKDENCNNVTVNGDINILKNLFKDTIKDIDDFNSYFNFLKKYNEYYNQFMLEYRFSIDNTSYKLHIKKQAILIENRFCIELFDKFDSNTNKIFPTVSIVQNKDICHFTSGNTLIKIFYLIYTLLNNNNLKQKFTSQLHIEDSSDFNIMIDDNKYTLSTYKYTLIKTNQFLYDKIGAKINYEYIIKYYKNNITNLLNITEDTLITNEHIDNLVKEFINNYSTLFDVCCKLLFNNKSFIKSTKEYIQLQELQQKLQTEPSLDSKNLSDKVSIIFTAIDNINKITDFEEFKKKIIEPFTMDNFIYWLTINKIIYFDNTFNEIYNKFKDLHNFILGIREHFIITNLNDIISIKKIPYSPANYEIINKNEVKDTIDKNILYGGKLNKLYNHYKLKYYSH